jgi:tRNA-Thr(GGU) m(6)t(6)A37 methyltransferase TsaA
MATGNERGLRERAVGTVTQGKLRPDRSSDRATGSGAVETAEITVDAAWAEALDGIEEFSHIWVLWWIDQYDDPPTTRHVHPERRPELPLVGLFATRSPHRPCPVGLTAVRLLGRDGGRLFVQGLDAYEGTPVLDIKPYLRRGDLIPNATMPNWLETLWQIHDAECQE